jgi:uncharacterized protein YbjT (DUF2867 family)
MNSPRRELTIEFSVVTGAFGYTGKYIAGKLLSLGRRVKTLTAHPERPNPFGDRIEVAPLNFDDPAGLEASIRGAEVLYNTYWVRFDHGRMTFDRAVANTKILIEAARQAGVRRIVHISITSSAEDDVLPYFRGKAELERAIRGSGISYAILRPTLIFGREDILLNNIAWLLRRFPAFAIPGRGDYKLQPVCVEDVAEIAARYGSESGNLILDAVGPETFTFDEMVRLIAANLGNRARIVHVRPSLALTMARLVSVMTKDSVLTRQELDGLMTNKLVSVGAPTARTLFSRWVKENAGSLGVRYSSELARHYH